MRASHFRAELKTRARDEVANAFAFKPTTTPSLLAKQRGRVEELKHEYAYAYQVGSVLSTKQPLSILQNPDEKLGFLKGRIVRNIVNKVWFKVTQRSKAEAVGLQRYYDPFPLVSFAITFAAVSSES
jgi:Domain of unknown function (DUF6532)